MHPFVQTVRLYSTKFSEKDLERYLKGKLNKNPILDESYRLWQSGANGKLYRFLNDLLRAREKSEYITKKVFGEKHLGQHTFETLKQEMFSLANTKEAFRDSKWKKRWEGIIKGLKKLPKAERKELGTNLNQLFKNVRQEKITPT